MWLYLTAGIGGALGAMARYGVSQKLASPLGTLVVNLAGAVLAGLLLAWLSTRPNDWLRVFVMVGVLGGLTTFSAFAVDAVSLFERREFSGAFLYAVASPVLAIGLAGAAYWVGRKVLGV